MEDGCTRGLKTKSQNDKLNEAYGKHNIVQAL